MVVETLHPPTDEPIALEPPTRVRYGVLGFLGTMTFILYLDRVCIGQATKAIQAELGINNLEMSYINTAFILAYAVFELPTGQWGDRYGARGVLTRIVLWWSAFTVLTGAAWNFWALLVIRFLFGAGEAGALPNSALVTRKWFPESMRASAQGFVTTAMLIGGAVSPIAAAALIEIVVSRQSGRASRRQPGRSQSHPRRASCARPRSRPSTDPLGTGPGKGQLVAPGRNHELWRGGVLCLDLLVSALPGRGA